MFMANASPNTRGHNANYIPLLALGLALGVQGFALGAQVFVHGPRGYLDTNMLVFPMLNGRIGGPNQCDSPTPVVLHCSGI